MAYKSISVPAVRVNDDLIRIVPNSFSYDGGEGEITVRSGSAGSGNSETVHSENAETQFSMCKFSVFLDTDTDGNIRDWKEEIGTNVVKVDQFNVNGSSFIRVFPGMSLINVVERTASADGVVELEFSGDPMIIQ